MCEIEHCLHDVHQRIQDAANHAARSASTIQLLAVSKTKPLAAIRQAARAGQRLFGENYVQEGVDKIKALAADANFSTPLQWHFIGPLQSNKTRLVAEHFDWVQSVCRFKVAERLSAQRPPHLQNLNICLQINVSQELNKSGISLEELPALAAQITRLPRIKLRGLMAIPENTADEATLGQQFDTLYHAYQDLQRDYPDIDTLSMGMSHDLELAVVHGCTMVRIGSAIFGARNYVEEN